MNFLLKISLREHNETYNSNRPYMKSIRYFD